MKYQVFLIPSAQKDLEPIKGSLFSKITKLLSSLSSTARPIGALKLTNEDSYRLRVGDYRILYRVDDKEKKIFIYRIRHRKEVYR